MRLVPRLTCAIRSSPRGRRGLRAGVLIVAGLSCTGLVRPEPDRELARHPAERLLQIAAEYRQYGRVDDLMRWAPELCMIPPPPTPHASRSTDPATHGRKLYMLYARQRDAYAALCGARARGAGETGAQVVVKEAWRPVELPGVSPDAARPRSPLREESAAGLDVRQDEGGTYFPYVVDGGRVFRADEPAGLFIMYESRADDPDADAGWVYGTVSADGQTVTAAGRIASCMSCHRDAPHGRLFGAVQLSR